MSDSPAAELVAMVRCWNSGTKEQRSALLSSIVGAPAKQAMIAQEISRLEQPGGQERRHLLHPQRPDFVSQRAHDTLKAIQAAVAAEAGG